MSFHIGQWVKWGKVVRIIRKPAQADRPEREEYVGLIVAVVPPGVRASECIPAGLRAGYKFCGTAKHTRYLVWLNARRRVVYVPLVSSLSPAEPEEAEACLRGQQPFDRLMMERILAEDRRAHMAEPSDGPAAPDEESKETEPEETQEAPVSAPLQRPESHEGSLRDMVLKNLDARIRRIVEEVLAELLK